MRQDTILYVRLGGTTSMVKDWQKMVAEAFGATPDLLPLLPAVFEDFRALGGWPEEIVGTLRESAKLPKEAAVVDLGCGKGGVSIPIAAELGYHVKGVDLFQPFLEQAVLAAREASVDHLCSFEVGDVREVVQESNSFDVAVFAAVGAGLFGDYSGCVAAIRQCVRPGGYMIIADGFLRHDTPLDDSFPGYEYYRSHDQVICELTAHQDILVREALISSERFTHQNLRDFQRIRRKVRELVEAHPQHRESLARFLVSQEAEYAFLNEATVEAIWLLYQAGLPDVE